MEVTIQVTNYKDMEKAIYLEVLKQNPYLRDSDYAKIIGMNYGTFAGKKQKWGMTSNIYGSILDTYTERDYKKEIETNPSITDKEIAKKWGVTPSLLVKFKDRHGIKRDARKLKVSEKQKGCSA
ncbi:TPA: hypothetical protein QC364_003714 [Bacillus cereus]|uniref:hypothetical protein n=1 Tax=Bacillus cereus TaxID=1396 RepID=UPI00286550D7|nr:hypothetical protein [Bacillus cereus]HDR8456835.1 hypothetical protein [Bacillus cereus]HDW3055539.1 hypothetical protein [Bacillus cereus]